MPKDALVAVRNVLPDPADPDVPEMTERNSMRRLLGQVKRTVGPMRPVTAGHVVLILFLSLVTFLSYPVNDNIAGYYCDVDAVAASGACPGLRAYMGWHTTILVTNIVTLFLMILTTVPVYMLLIVFIFFLTSDLAVLSLWIAVFFTDVSMYTRELSFIREEHGVAANAIVLVSFLGAWYCFLPAKKG